MPAVAFLERAVEGAAINQEVLSSDVAGLRRTQKCTGRAEFVWISEASGRNARDACLSYVSRTPHSRAGRRRRDV